MIFIVNWRSRQYSNKEVELLYKLALIHQRFIFNLGLDASIFGYSELYLFGSNGKSTFDLTL